MRTIRCMEQHRSTPGTSSAAEAQILTPLEAAAWLRVSKRTLWTLTRDAGLRSIRIGRAVRYDIRDLVGWIDSQVAKGARNAS